jgi:hypothetical protein
MSSGKLFTKCQPMPNPNSPKKLKPVHILMLRLFCGGASYVQIAQETSYTPQQVMNVIQSPDAQEIISQLNSDVVDSISEVQDRLTEIAPEVLNKKIQHALYSPDAAVSSRACTDLLHMAGHMPVQRLRLERDQEIAKKYDGLTEDQLRQQILNSVTGKGPDGRPLN